MGYYLERNNYKIVCNFKFYIPGGFVPREPVIDGPFYESKFGKPFSNHNKAHDHMSNAQLPPITEPPKLFEEGNKTYQHFSSQMY